ncbi:hypothetical protein BH09ACT4_BH09ACT4_15310 [soil metagenome]
MENMIIVVTTSGVSLRDPREFGDFHVEAGDGVDLAEALTVAGAGRFAGDDVFVSTDWIRDVMAEREDDDEQWRASFEAMLGFARSQGWIAEDGDGIRAHVVSVIE